MGKPSLRPEDIVDPSAPWIKADPTRNGWYEVWVRYGWGGEHPREQVTTMLWRDGKWDRSDSYARTAEVVAHLEPMRIPDTGRDPLDEHGAVRLSEWVVRETMEEYREALRVELRHPDLGAKVEIRRDLEKAILGRRFDILSMSVVDERDLIRREREKAILDVYHTPAPWFDWDRPVVCKGDVVVSDRSSSASSRQRILSALRDGPQTVNDLVAVTGINISSVQSGLRQLEADGKVRRRKAAHSAAYIWELT